MEKIIYNEKRSFLMYITGYLIIAPLLNYLVSGTFSFKLFYALLFTCLIHYYYSLSKHYNRKAKDIFFSTNGISFYERNGEKVFIEWNNLMLTIDKTFYSKFFQPVLVTSSINSEVKEYISVDWLSRKSYFELANKYCPEDNVLRKYVNTVCSTSRME